VAIQRWQDKALEIFFLFLVRPYSGRVRCVLFPQVVGRVQVGKWLGGNWTRNKASGVGQYSEACRSGMWQILLNGVRMNISQVVAQIQEKIGQIFSHEKHEKMGEVARKGAERIKNNGHKG
jgi:hypothetical protein